jgi:hypothetical protein
VHPVEKREHRVAAVGELATVGDVRALAVVNGLGPDEALGDGDVANDVAERERARLVGPFGLRLRNTEPVKKCDV